MKVGIVRSSALVGQKLTASSHIDPTARIDVEIERTRRRMAGDRARLRRLVLERRVALKFWRETGKY